MLDLLGFETPVPLKAVFVCVLAFALVRGVFRYAEQACNHFIAFKLLALLRDRVFRALRRLCPAKLEGRDKGDLISVITSDIELLEVFYAHTISPAVIAALFTVILCVFIGRFHWALGLLALAAYVTVGVVIPLVTSRLSGDAGLRLRMEAGALAGFVLDSLRGLSETIQFGRGRARLDEMNARTDALAGDEARMKRVAGRNTAVTNTVILLFDLAMLLTSAALCRAGESRLRRGAHPDGGAVLVVRAGHRARGARQHAAKHLCRRQPRPRHPRRDARRRRGDGRGGDRL